MNIILFKRQGGLLGGPWDVPSQEHVSPESLPCTKNGKFRIRRANIKYQIHTNLPVAKFDKMLESWHLSVFLVNLSSRTLVITFTCSHCLRPLYTLYARYTPQTVELDYKLKPFIPDYIPCIGDIDAFIKVCIPTACVHHCLAFILIVEKSRVSLISLLRSQVKAPNIHV